MYFLVIFPLLGALGQHTNTDEFLIYTAPEFTNQNTYEIRPFFRRRYLQGWAGLATGITGNSMARYSPAAGIGLGATSVGLGAASLATGQPYLGATDIALGATSIARSESGYNRPVYGAPSVNRRAPYGNRRAPYGIGRAPYGNSVKRANYGIRRGPYGNGPFGGGRGRFGRF